MVHDAITKEVQITPELIEAGVGVLRDAFGGETEGANRFVDFSQTVQAILALPSTRRASRDLRG